MDLIRDFASRVEKLYVIEELEPFMEDQIKAAGILRGQGADGPSVRAEYPAAAGAGAGRENRFPQDGCDPGQPSSGPLPGCPHRGFFYTLSKNKNYVVTGDIGCYTLGSAALLNCMDSVVCMGAGFSAGMGIAKSFEREGVTDKTVFGVMGDSPSSTAA